MTGQHKRKGIVGVLPPDWFLKEIIPELLYDRARGIIRWKYVSGTRSSYKLGNLVSDNRIMHAFRSPRGDVYSADMAKLAWYIVHGKWPTISMRFADGDPQNLRLENLTLAPRHSIQVSKTASGGYRGQAQIEGETVYLGSWPTEEEARTQGMLRLKTKLLLLKRQKATTVAP